MSLPNLKQGCRCAGDDAPLALSVGYAPPEVIFAYSVGLESMRVNTAADMWSVGVIAYELMTARPAFPAHMAKDDVIAALLGKQPLPWEAADAATLRKLLRLKGAILQCLTRNPADRPSAADFAGAVEHAFLPSATTTTICQRHQ